MKKYIFILTDCKRNSLHVGYSDDLLSTVNLYKEKRNLFFDNDTMVSRLVYSEEFYREEEALIRFNEFKAYTRQQKERLIRQTNPNWQDLTVHFELDYHPGAKFKPNVPNLTSFR